MDTTATEFVNGLAGHVDSIDDLAALLAQYTPFLLIGFLIVLWFWPGARDMRDRRQWGGIAAVTATAVALGVNQVIIRLWDRPRPFLSHHSTLLINPARDASFPSDHTTVVFAIAVSLALVDRRIGVASLVLATLCGFARVYAGAHYLGDVLAGAAIGSAVAYALFQLRPFVFPRLAPLWRITRPLHLS